MPLPGGRLAVTLLAIAMADSTSDLGRTLSRVAFLIGVASLVDIVGRQVYRSLRETMPNPEPWSPESALHASARILSETRGRVHA